MNYAILTDGIVESVIVLNDENAQDFPGAVKLFDIPAAIGDQYADGLFYRNGEPLLPFDPETASAGLD
ncbi:MAG TPA: hypothetical protein PKU80_02870 [Candidatus Limiplasma sp.]|nr:hypothetical protein [Candidatus Limiplasma sp.]HRX08127.1 hypothetical protein [Candidatus Limiplasma sp.]